MQSLPGGGPTMAGRMPIACFNCASAKTACDKRVPCSRCADKNLACAARLARRSSKAAFRLAASSNNMPAQHPNNNNFMDVDHIATQGVHNESRTISIDNRIDSQPRGSLQKTTGYSTQVLRFGTDTFETSPSTSLGGVDDFMRLNSDLMYQEVNYQDLAAWNEHPLDLGMYSNTGAEMTKILGMPSFTELRESSSRSEAMTSGSTGTSSPTSRTRKTSIDSQADFESLLKMTESAPSSTSDTMIPEFEVVIAAEAAWPLAQCNPRIFSGACPRTAIVHLESLEQKSKHEGTWKSLAHKIATAELNDTTEVSIVPLSASTRDRILAIAQSFLHKALETHRGGLNGWPKTSGYPSPGGGFNFLVLPPSNVLEYLLRSYVRSLATYYSLINSGKIDPNELMLNNQASTLLVLLMIAQGATTPTTAEARCLTAGLTETCRISLFDIIEKDVELSADPIVLRCALLFTILGAWSGDAWHMNIAMGQRGMYLGMLKHAGMLEPQPAMTESFDNSASAELHWRAWLQRENKSRLVYNWVMVDQELSLFHDTAPILSITELETPIPSPEGLWLAKNVDEWLSCVQQTSIGPDGSHPNSLAGPPLPPSLWDLFRDMFHGGPNRPDGQLSPLQLKLLLHPLQSLVCHLRHTLTCVSHVSGSRSRTRSPAKAYTLLRLEEVQSLLQTWYDLCAVYVKADPSCLITRANLVLYHLISLNTVTSFPEIERLAREGGSDGSLCEISLRYKRCIYQPEEALVHCGQVIRHICSMHKGGRPHWWPAAIYRATMILWVSSVLRLDANVRKLEKGQIVAIDAVTPEHPSVESYLWGGEGVPVLTKVGGYTSLDKPDEVLSHCITLLDQGVALRLSDGIKRKLQTLSENWSLQPMQDPV